MAMTSDEMIAFFGEQAESAKSGFSVGLTKENYHLCAMNATNVFKCWLMQGLVSWRHGISPIESFRKAINQFVELKAEIPIASQQSDELCLTAQQARIVAFLIDVPSPFNDADGAQNVYISVQCAIAGFLWKTSSSAPKWEELFSGLRKEKASALALETYTCYASLISSQSGDLKDRVVNACKLFEQRSKDRYFRGAHQSEGGGPDNKSVVDYRLSAICKRLKYKWDSVHCWKW